MADLNLPDDLAAFLRTGRQLEYHDDEAGIVTSLPLDRLRVEFFPMSSTSPEDPHGGEGSYLVKGVRLIASGYDLITPNLGPVASLLWLPLDKRYGWWDGDHGTIGVFGPDVGWSDITRDLPQYINPEWGLARSAAVTDLIPWPKHPHNPEQLCHPLPDIAE